jgi:hypothetical protein
MQGTSGARRRTRSTLGLMLVALSTIAFIAWPAAAEENTDLSKTVEALQIQIQNLQKQLDALKAAEAKRDAAVAAAQSSAQASAQAAAQAKKTATFERGTLTTNHVKLTVGGFIEAASIWRSRNQTADVGSSYNTGIPFPNSPNYNLSEFRESARQSRLSLLAQGSVNDNIDLAAYFESDFLGVGTASNSLESNSYTPRLRVAYATVDLKDSGWHFLGGQAWSLLTQNKIGIEPRQENIPPTIDAQYVVGFNWTRNPGLRVVKDFPEHKLAAGLSVESPQANVVIGPNKPLVTTTTTNPGGSLLNSLATYSTDFSPDVIGKLTWDPGWGHYEVYGIGRFFRDRADGHNNTTMGGGGGASALLPLVPGKLELTASFLYGTGIGRYGSAQLPDYTIDAFGNPSTITAFQGLVGLIGHPTKSWDLYAYAGTEQAERTATFLGSQGFGYGSPLYNNSGCLIEGSTLCAQNTSGIWQATLGTWYNLYKGDFGMLRLGAQYSYTHRDIFSGIGGAPSTDDNMVFASFRYYPF